MSAYLSKDPRLVSSLKASDIIEVICVALSSLAPSWPQPATPTHRSFRSPDSLNVKRTIPLIASFIIGLVMVGDSSSPPSVPGHDQ